jgi:NAD/NADP transhydrogenase beta subunit
VGVILILFGAAFMLEQTGVVVLTGNWWSVFIYLGAAASFINAWRSYRARGEAGSSAGGSLTWGLVLTVVATIFLLDLEWNTWWPAILIAVGAGMVLSSVLRNVSAKSPRDPR